MHIPLIYYFSDGVWTDIFSCVIRFFVVKYISCDIPLAFVGFKNLEVEERFQKANQSIKQCLHQLAHLKRVWVDVLPTSNYCKAIGRSKAISYYYKIWILQTFSLLI